MQKSKKEVIYTATKIKKNLQNKKRRRKKKREDTKTILRHRENRDRSQGGGKIQ